MDGHDGDWRATFPIIAFARFSASRAGSNGAHVHALAGLAYSHATANGGLVFGAAGRGGDVSYGRPSQHGAGRRQPPPGATGELSERAHMLGFLGPNEASDALARMIPGR